MGLMTINVVTLADSSRPRLVVGIIVDQLRTDYLDYLRNRFGEKGFNRLINGGLYLRDVDFKATVSDAPTGTALVYTGAYPACNGVTASEIFSQIDGSVRPALLDPDFIGNFTDQNLSPANLRLSTISDEIAIDGMGLGLVYAIAADPQQAVIMAGHAGNSALWLNKNTGNWCSTTYYRDFPQRVSQRNHRNPLSSRIDTICWRPSLPLGSYHGLPAQKLQYPFSHTFPRSDRDVYRRFSLSAPGNREVTDVAIDCLQEQRLGNRGDVIDMINVAYSAAPYKYVADGDYRLELQDTYIALDRQIERLIDAVDKQVGVGNALIFISSTGYYDDAVADDPRYRIPGGDISLKRMESLLNSYLSAKHGNGDYVNGIHARQIFLNPAVIDGKGLAIESIRDEAREFVVRMSGVADARTLGEILADSSPEGEAIRLSIDPKHAGDIILEFNPGWNIVDDQKYPATSSPVRTTAVNTPALIFAPGIGSETIDTPVKATAIAPTLTSVLHIRSPNGAKDKPLY